MFMFVDSQMIFIGEALLKKHTEHVILESWYMYKHTKLEETEITLGVINTDLTTPRSST